MQEASRREKRRLLDAQRGKCRVRLGSHLDEWCALKDHLGFSLHSQLAKFLLDSYRTSSGVGTPDPKPIALLSVSVPSLQRLAFLCQQHGRTCNSFPTILTKPCSLEAPEAARLLWGCKEDHRFHWDPHDSSAGPGGNSAEEDVPCLPFMRQEDVPEMPQEGGPVMTAEDKVDLPRVELEPHGTALQEGLYEEPSRSDTSPNASPEQCDDAEDSQTTAANGWPLNTNVPEKQQEEGTDEALCRGQEIIVPSSEVGGTEDARPQMVEISEDTQESISMNLAKKPKSPSFGEECKKPEKPLSECHQQTLMSEPKAALSFTCRRSPRSSKGCRMKVDVTVQAPVSRVQLRSVARACSGMKGQDVDVLVGSAPNTDASQTTSLVQESLAGNSPRRKPPSEDLEGLATVEEKEPPSAEPQSDHVQMPRAPEEDVPNAEMELHDNTRQEPQSAQCRGQKAGRRKSLIDEELAQICKKRIRKATAQELLMCEYDDCGKIFSKRQYLNYHQKYQHMNQRTFRCSVTECGKTFNFKKHLKEHEKRHSDRRDFICEFCARAFRSSSNLIIHRRIHTGEKPLQCEFCGFTCRQKASLNWHMKKHDADSSYKFPCDICGQRFEKRDNLAAHKSRKHPAPREAGPQDASRCVTSSVCHLESSGQDDGTVTKDPDQEVTPAAPEGVKETLFPGYLDLSNSMQEVSQQTTPGNTGISLVIVL